jgi:hypothetical protein
LKEGENHTNTQRNKSQDYFLLVVVMGDLLMWIAEVFKEGDVSQNKPEKIE